MIIYASFQVRYMLFTKLVVTHMLHLFQPKYVKAPNVLDFPYETYYGLLFLSELQINCYFFFFSCLQYFLNWTPSLTIGCNEKISNYINLNNEISEFIAKNHLRQQLNMSIHQVELHLLNAVSLTDVNHHHYTLRLRNVPWTLMKTTCCSNPNRQRKKIHLLSKGLQQL